MEIQLSEDKKFLEILSCTQDEYDQVKLSFTKKIDGHRYHLVVFNYLTAS